MNSSMMAAASPDTFLFPNPGEFNFELTNAEEWTLYKFRLERYLRSPSFKNLDNDSKIDILLATMGKAADKIYLSFREKLTCSTTVDEVLEQFDQYLHPKFNIISLRAKFIRRVQRENEPILYFLRDLYQLAEPCEFLNKEDQIRDQLILGLANTELSMALRNDPEVTLDKAVSKLRAWGELQMNQNETKMDRWRDETPAQEELQMNQNETNMDRWRDETPAQKELCQQCQLQGHWSQFCHSYPQVECSCRNKNSGRGMMENSFVMHPGQNSFSEFQECSSTQSFQRDPLSSLSHRTSPHLATLAAIAPTDSMGPPSVTHLKHKQAQDLFKQEDDIAKSLAHRRLGPPPQRHEPHSSQSHLERSPQRRASPSRDTSFKRKRVQDFVEQARSPQSKRDNSSILSPPSKRRPLSKTDSTTDSEMLRRRQIDLRMKTDGQRCKAESQSDHRSSASTSRPKRRVMETAHEVLRRRQKEIDYGKNTEGYRCYLAAVPKHKRSHRDIRTPPREIKYGRRAWDGMVRAWRRQLHKWDPPGHDDSLDNLDCNSGEGWCVLSSLDDTNNTTETSACPSDTGSEISYSGSGGNLRAAQSPSSTLSLDDFPHLV